MVLTGIKLRSHCFLYLVCICSCYGLAPDAISSGQSLSPNQTLISKEGKFELGFFSPGASTDFYVGIWYKRISVKTIVWVANRNNPIPSSNIDTSRLELLKGGLFLSFNSEVLVIARTLNDAARALILDTGNFVLLNDVGVIWQSFDYPTDTWLPGGTVGFRGIDSSEMKLVSWRNSTEPGQGKYSFGMARNNGGAELVIWLNGNPLWNSAPYESGDFTFMVNSFNFSFVSTENDLYFRYNTLNETVMSRIVIDFYGTLKIMLWHEASQEWLLSWRFPSPSDKCNKYCGPNAICDIGSAPPCSCLAEFAPTFKEDWDLNDFSGGCMRGNLECNKGNAEFVNESNIRSHANSQSLEVGRSDICEYVCSTNCSCSAYSFSSKYSCSLYFGDMLDVRRGNGTGVDLYIRMSSTNPRRKGGQIRILVFALSGITVLIVAGSLIFFLHFKFKRKAFQRAYQNLLLLDLSSTGPANNQHTAVEEHRGELDNKDYELPIFSFSSIMAAADNFSARNRLGEGGFGPVYKGELANGQFVAVKRLSKLSGQGLEEFRNETQLIAKLQHRNLVRILGCCVHEDEKILVYEYMPNKSLDSFLFDPTKKELLDWTRRVQIIEGIAQGLLYLHQYSRLRIVHRDLKAGNILLDDDMRPKISDFGMARIFRGNDSQAKTKRIVGTYGYMSPEYAMGGTFSIKSDVFAFGVLLLEILSGRKNTGFFGSDSYSLLGHAWKLWQNNETIELLDPKIEVPSSSSFLPLRYTHVGLLCVQECPNERPTMLEVVAMLNNEQATLASPQHPAFTAGRICCTANAGNRKDEIHSANNITVSLMEPR